MLIKTIIASLIISILLSLLAFLVNLSNIFPVLVAFFIISFMSGCLTSIWITKPASESKPARKATKKTSSAKKETGSVKWFSASKGFGFITRDAGDDIFVHFRSILGKGHRILQEGQRVEFIVTDGSKGLQAEEVSMIK